MSKESSLLSTFLTVEKTASRVLYDIPGSEVYGSVGGPAPLLYVQYRYPYVQAGTNRNSAVTYLCM